MKYRQLLVAFFSFSFLFAVACSRQESEEKRGGTSQKSPVVQSDFTSSIGLEMKLLPHGSFLIGSHQDEWLREENEGNEISPTVQLARTISKPFYLGIFEVTQEQYEQVMGIHRSFFTGAKRPVDTVSWNEAQEFCKKLTEKDRLAGKITARQRYRLPTEAEWEYACRAGTTTRFYWGDDRKEEVIDEYAWYDDASIILETHEVGQKKPNSWGLYDLSGNVAEWCEDVYEGQYYSEEQRGSKVKSDETNANSTEKDRVIRGGHWSALSRECRSASRFYLKPCDYGPNFGFRVVLDLDEQAQIGTRTREMSE